MLKHKWHNCKLNRTWPSIKTDRQSRKCISQRKGQETHDKPGELQWFKAKIGKYYDTITITGTGGMLLRVEGVKYKSCIGKIIGKNVLSSLQVPNAIRVWFKKKRKENAYITLDTVPTMKHGGGSNMLWECLCLAEHGKLVRVN